MDKPLDPDSPRYLEKDERAGDIRFNDRRWLVNASVHVRFRRKMNNRIAAPHGGFDSAAIADISFNELVSGILCNTFQVGKICSVGQLVVIED
jgi:hypothetical protein